MKNTILRLGLLAVLIIMAPRLVEASTIKGIVMDINGKPVDGAQLTLASGSVQRGADYVSVFSGPDGRFKFPDSNDWPGSDLPDIRVRALAYELLDVTPGSASSPEWTVVLKHTLDDSAIAPPSAWLASINDRSEKSSLVRNCVGCHQVPAPEVRAYAGQIAEVVTQNPAEARRQSWLSIVKYMNYLSAWEFGRNNPDGPPRAGHAYSIGPGEEVSQTLARHFTGTMDRLEGYSWGAPLAVTPATVIREFEVPGTNAVREAMLLGSTPRLWVADVATNRMFAIDPVSGEQEVTEVPFDGASGPHSLHRAADGSLWVTPFFPSVIARLDPDENHWQTWPTQTVDGRPIGIHDLSFGAKHELLADNEGRLWYSDIINNAVGYFNPATGAAEIFPAPEVEGRPGEAALLYGLIMTSDRKHIWFSQLGIGSFGNFNVETREFETREVLPDVNAGPRRLTISESDVMYVPLYGSGQLVEYDTFARKQLGIYDLPDTGSAPYAVTWDPVRKVVWIANSNADAIYRFDPANKSFGVIPMPRTGALLRMIDIDPATGVLVTSYANIVEFVKGPRMALIVDPGDGAYSGREEGTSP